MRKLMLEYSLLLLVNKHGFVGNPEYLQMILN